MQNPADTTAAAIAWIEKLHGWGDCEKHGADSGRHCHCAITVAALRAGEVRTCRHCGTVVEPLAAEAAPAAPTVEARTLTAGRQIRHEGTTVALTSDARPFTTYGGRPAVRLSGTTADGILWTGDADPDTAVELARTVDLHDLLDPTTPATGVPLEHVAATIRGWYEADAPAADDCAACVAARDVLDKAEEFQAALIANDLVTAAELAGEIGIGYDLHPA